MKKTIRITANHPKDGQAGITHLIGKEFPVDDYEKETDEYTITVAGEGFDGPIVVRGCECIRLPRVDKRMPKIQSFEDKARERPHAGSTAVEKIEPIQNPVRLGFYPDSIGQAGEMPGIREIFANDTARTLWLIWKPRHIVSQHFNTDVLVAARAIDEAKPRTPESLEACFRGARGNFTSGDVRRLALLMLPFFTGEAVIEYLTPDKIPPLRAMADVPNEEGFKLFALTNQGSRLEATVKKRVDGTHYIADDVNGVRLAPQILKGWEPRA